LAEVTHWLDSRQVGAAAASAFRRDLHCAKKPPQPQYQRNARQLHGYVPFMGNTGMRPDEAKNLQHRDVPMVTDPGSGQEILEIEVSGKRGIGFCNSMAGRAAVIGGNR